jgi:hypothetical protein
VLTAEGRHESARQAAEDRWVREEASMTYNTEDFVRRAAGGILRGDKYRGKYVCLPCLVTMTLERLHPGWRQSEIERAMDKVSKTPGAITYMPTFNCALCQKTMPCLGAPPR